MLFLAIAVTITCAGVVTVLIRGSAPTLSSSQRQLLDEAHADLARSWLLTGDGTGGYATFTSSMPPSLYSTAWIVRLFDATGTGLANVDAAAVAASMRAAIDQPVQSGLPALEALWLSADTLVRLDSPVPNEVIARQLPSYLTADGLYALEPGGAGAGVRPPSRPDSRAPSAERFRRRRSIAFGP